MMITRRSMICALLGYPVFLASKATFASDRQSPFNELTYPPFEAINEPEKFAYSAPTQEQRDKAKRIINSTPSGAHPLDVAQSFVDRFYVNDPEAIAQWPVPKPWNPLIVEFFTATSQFANNDMIPWCAAFANWCLERANHIGSKDPSSQSFLTNEYFKLTDDGQPGDLAIFTCYNSLNKSLGIGHVAFLKQRLSDSKIRVVGGNQSLDGNHSIICERTYVTTGIHVKRKVLGKEIICLMKLRTYIRIV